jgi:hypothetical protein
MLFVGYCIVAIMCNKTKKKEQGGKLRRKVASSVSFSSKISLDGEIFFRKS